jgi:signal transduction histidine kinase
MEDNFWSRGRWIALSARTPDGSGELDELRREVENLLASRRRLVLADDAARRDLERAFHDGVQQRLVGLAAGLELAASVDADPDLLRVRLAEIGREVANALEVTRSLAHRIYPPLIEAGGLAPALRAAAAERDVPTRIRIDAGIATEPEIAGAVYFCCLEILERVGVGTPVTIEVRREERALSFELLVADRPASGPISPAPDRIEALGGRLTIGRDAEGRTQVLGSVPSG